jgi:hypothetical protein
VGYATHLPLCFTWQTVYRRLLRLYVVIYIYNFVPTIFMVVVYYKIGREVIKQSKHMKRACPDAVRKRHIRDRRTFLVCLATVLCFGIGSFPISVWYIFTLAHESNSIKKYVWMNSLGVLLRLACSYSANPVIYRILDKKLLKFWKHCCMQAEHTRRPREQLVQHVGETPL